MLFNLLFISFYQQFLIMLFSAPMLIAASYTETPLNRLDYLAAGLMFLFILMETIADNQQYKFHRAKQGNSDGMNKYARSLELGFLAEGLWKYVRHPNYTAEQAIWVSFYLFGVAATGNWINPTLAGPVLLILLFIGSTAFTESISKGKYPAYTGYQKQVPRLFPLRLKRGK